MNCETEQRQIMASRREKGKETVIKPTEQLTYSPDEADYNQICEQMSNQQSHLANLCLINSLNKGVGKS
jgi:hypothetical protein